MRPHRARKRLALWRVIVGVAALLISVSAGLLALPRVAEASGALPIRPISQYQGWGSQACDCGPTSVAMTVYYLNGGYPRGISSDKALVGQARTNTGTSTSKCSGTSARELERSIRSFGFAATKIGRSGDDGSSEVQAMQDATNAGNPVIGLVNGHYLGHKYDGHYVVVRGFSADGRTVYIDDPGDESGSWGLQYSVSRDTFRQAELNAPPGGYGIIVSVDRSAPTVTAPVASLPANSAIGSSSSVRLAWTGSDAGSGISHYQVALSTNGGSYVLVDNPTTSSYTRSMAFSSTTTYRFRVRAYDNAGNVSGWAYGRTFRDELVQESSAGYSGGWSTATTNAASGNSDRYTSTTGGYASYTFTGRAIAIVATTGTSFGEFKVYVDGVRMATVSEDASSTHWRRIVYSLNVNEGTHRIKLVCIGTSGHPEVDLDAFVVLR